MIRNTPSSSSAVLPRVSIVGAPNVGKSTLFNRLTGGRRAIVTDRPGVTRDRIEGRVETGPGAFLLVDTGGMLPEDRDGLARAVTEQALRAVDDSALVLLVVDARRGLTPLDLEVARTLRVRGARALAVANKIDGPERAADAGEAAALGLGEPLAVSAEHGLGIGELLEAIEEALGGLPEGQEVAEDEVRVALVGRPNVGKSSLLNRLADDQRVTVSEVAGTTRDAVDTLLVRRGRRYRVVDTAGIRRPGRMRDVAERASVARARRAIRDSHVTVVLVDATAGLTAGDLAILGEVRDAHRPLVVAVNKWDIVPGPEEAAARWSRALRERVRFAPQAPVVFLSALTGSRVDRVLGHVDRLDALSRTRVSTGRLNRVLEASVPDGRIPGRGGRAPRLFYATQTGIRPPRFLVFTERAESVPAHFRRYLENRLREAFALGPVPLVLQFRTRPRRDAPGGRR